MLIGLALIGFCAVATAQTAEKKTKKVETIVLNADIDCASCAKKIDNTIPDDQGDKEDCIDFDTKQVTVCYDPPKCSEVNIVMAFDKIIIVDEMVKSC